MHEVLVNCLGGLSLSRKSVVRLTDRPDMTLDVYRGRKTIQQQLTFKSTNTHAMQTAYYLWQLSAGKAVTLDRYLPYFYHLITLNLHLLNYITRNEQF